MITDGKGETKGESGRRPLRFFPLDYATMVAFLAYSASVTATPICLVAISRELGLSLTQAGSLEAARSALVFVTLLGSGFVAARLGKVLALGSCSLLMGAGMLLYSAAPSYGALLMALGALGLSGGVVEALINPLVQELHPEDSGRYLNLINAFWSIGVLGTMLLTGEALSWGLSWRAVIATVGGLCFASGAMFLLLRRTGKPRPRVSMGSVLREKGALLRLPRFWLFSWLMFLGGATEGAFTYWSASLMQLHYGAAPRAAGVGVALFAAGMIAARLCFGWLVPQERLWRLLFVSALGGLAVSPLVPLVDGVGVAYATLFAAGVSVACFWPSLQSYAVERLRREPTSVFILLSCGGVTGFAAVSWAMGALGDWVGLRASFWLVPALFLAMAGSLGVERRWRPAMASPNEADLGGAACD